VKTIAAIPTRFVPDTFRQLLVDLRYLDEHDLVIVLDDTDDQRLRHWLPEDERDPKLEVWHPPAHLHHDLYGMWNFAWSMLLESYPDEEINLAFLNDDITIPTQEFLAPLAEELRADPDRGIVCPDYRLPLSAHSVHHGPDLVRGTYRNHGICGWAFMFAAEWHTTRGVPFVDPQFEWWCGDDDLVRQLEIAGAKPAIVTGLPVDHMGEYSAQQVPELHQTKYDDLVRFNKKYGGMKR
jgi:hypothetical protein